MAKRKTDADQIRDLLLWARKERIEIRDLTVGTVSVSVLRDHKMEISADVRDVAKRRPSMLERFAGPLAGAIESHESAMPEALVEEDE